MNARPLTMIVAVLLVGAAALFPVAVGVEKNGEKHTDAEAGSEGVSGPDERGEEEREEQGEEGEKVLGLELESPLLVVAAVALSLAAAAVVLWRPTAVVLGLIALFAFAFGVLDSAEALKQLGESRWSIVALAAVLAAAHFTAAGVAGWLSTAAKPV